jgi:hypothetical protein
MYALDANGAEPFRKTIVRKLTDLRDDTYRYITPETLAN